MPGIYKIINTVTNQIYVGSSMSCIYQRYSYHKKDLRANKHHSAKLQNSWNKYGEKCFDFQIIEECSNVLQREQYYIDTLNPFFNICKVAGNCSGRKFSDETRLKMSIIAKKRGLNSFLKAQQKSPYPPETETEKYCSKHKCYHNREMFGKKKGNACKEWQRDNRISRAVPGSRKLCALRKAHPVISKNDNWTYEFESIRDGVRKLSVLFPKINKTCIVSSIISSKIYYGYIWSYKNA